MSEPPATGSREARPRLRGIEDDYGLVLVAIVVSLVILGLVSERPGGRIAALILTLSIFFLTMQASAAPRRTISRLAMLMPLALAVGVVSEILGSRAYVSGLSPLISAVFVIASVVFIVRRLATHRHVTRRTVFGSLCIYLFIGLMFALVYSSIALLGGEPFFAQTDDPSGLDYIYFSFVTIATVGFGDLSPATDLGRMAAVIEGIGGQLYLVVVVALFVSNLGHQKRSLRGDDQEGGDD
jgi:hypothetical protein